MSRTVVLSLLCLAVAAPAMAQETRPRLVTGGVEPNARFAGQDVKASLFASKGLTLGALADSTQLADDSERVAAGAFASYKIDAFNLTSSVRGDVAASAVDLGAAHAGGLGTTTLTLGYEWSGRPTSFSLNPATAATMDAAGPASDLSLTLSFSHDVSPALHLGGFAAATRSEYEDRITQQGFKLGAGLGYRF